MKYLLTLAFCLTITTFFAQDKGINLINNKSNDTTFLKEHRRIKVKTTDGKTVAGKFSIINDSEINIKDRIITIDSIVSIRKASTLSGIARPISFTLGTVFFVGGIAASNDSSVDGSFANNVGLGLMSVGSTLIIIPLTAQKHLNKKWKYEIVNE